MHSTTRTLAKIPAVAIAGFVTVAGASGAILGRGDKWNEWYLDKTYAIAAIAGSLLVGLLMFRRVRKWRLWLGLIASLALLYCGLQIRDINFGGWDPHRSTGGHVVTSFLDHKLGRPGLTVALACFWAVPAYFLTLAIDRSPAEQDAEPDL